MNQKMTIKDLTLEEFEAALDNFNHEIITKVQDFTNNAINEQMKLIVELSKSIEQLLHRIENLELEVNRLDVQSW